MLALVACLLAPLSAAAQTCRDDLVCIDCASGTAAQPCRVNYTTMHDVRVPLTVSHSNVTITCSAGGGFRALGDFGAALLIITGDSVSVQGCMFEGRHRVARAILAVKSARLVLDGNTIQNFATHAGNGTLLLLGTTNAQVLRNTIRGNNSHGIEGLTYAVGEERRDLVGSSIRQNTVDTTGGAGIEHGIALHAEARGTRLMNNVVAGNTITNGTHGACVEIGSFKGLEEDGLMNEGTAVTDNTCVASADLNAGGYSFSGCNQRFTLADNRYDARGFNIGIAGIEITSNSSQGKITGNTITLGGRGTDRQPALVNDMSHDNLWSGNTVNGFGRSDVSAAFYIGFSHGVAAIFGRNAGHNTFVGNTINFPRGGRGMAIWQQCNAAGVECGANVFGSATSPNVINAAGSVPNGYIGKTNGILLENDSVAASAAGAAVAHNVFRDLASPPERAIAIDGRTANTCVIADHRPHTADYGRGTVWKPSCP